MPRSGWIAIAKDLLDKRHDLHPFTRGEEACRAFAWIDLLGMVRWEDGGGLERGQTRIKQRELAARWNWSRAKVRRFLSQLEEDDRIFTDPQSGPKPTIVTVCNYDRYQFSKNGSGPKSGPRSGPTPYKEEQEQHRAHARGRKTCSRCGKVHRSRLCPRCYGHIQGRV